MSIRSYFMVKQRNLPELETMVSSSVTETVRTEVKRIIGMKCATDEEGDSSESKRGDENTYIILQIWCICNIKWVTPCIGENKYFELKKTRGAPMGRPKLELLASNDR